MPEQVQLLPEQGIVIKRFSDPALFERELYIYLKNPEFAPQLLDHNHHDELVTRYLDCQNLGQRENPDFTAIGPLFYALHHLEDTVICHRDTNPRNYLQSPQGTWMIDFTNWEYGRPEEDLVHFLLFWASIRVPEVFSEILVQVISGYPGFCEVDPADWREASERMVRLFDERRGRYGRSRFVRLDDMERNRELLLRAR
jgi:aminoglycoside phosphotransferase (APT) family kinase protein